MDVTLSDLWLPIVLTGVLTHILSTLAWTVLPHHKPEWQKFPAEDALQGTIAEANVPSGQFLFPFARDAAELNSEDYRARQEKCRGMLILWAKTPQMGVAILQTLLFFLFVAFLIGYLASLALNTDANFMKVFQFVATAGLLTHCAGMFPGNFWFKKHVAMDLVDKVVYGLATGLVFAALWPAA